MGKYSETPLGLALIVCDTVIEDKMTNKKSLIGLFSQINVKSLPYVHQSMAVLVSLTGGKGEYPVQIVCQHAEMDKPVFDVTCDINCQSPMNVHELVFQFKNVRFEHPDYYWIKVIIDEVPILMRPIKICPKSAPCTES